MGAQQSSEPAGTWSVQAVDPLTNAPLGEPISGIDSGAYARTAAPTGGFFDDVFGGIGSGIEDIWNLAKDAASTIIHLPGDVIHAATDMAHTAGSTVTDVAHEAGGAVSNVTGAATDIMSSPILLIAGAAVLLIALK